jgi:hypothetical protein
MSNEAQIIQAIKDLQSAQKTQLNRHLACEAMVYSLLYRTDPAALAGLAEEYDLAIDRLAEQIPPHLQLPQVWSEFASAIADLRKQHGQVG